MALANRNITVPEDIVKKQLRSNEFWFPGTPELNPCD
jgi:hypothetical protein